MKPFLTLILVTAFLASPLRSEESDALRFSYGEGRGSDSFTLSPPAPKASPSDIDLIFQSMEDSRASEKHADDIYVYRGGSRSNFNEAPSSIFELPERYYGPVSEPARENFSQPTMMTPPAAIFPDPASLNSLTGPNGVGITESRW